MSICLCNALFLSTKCQILFFSIKSVPITAFNHPTPFFVIATIWIYSPDIYNYYFYVFVVHQVVLRNHFW